MAPKDLYERNEFATFSSFRLIYTGDGPLQGGRQYALLAKITNLKNGKIVAKGTVAELKRLKYRHINYCNCNSYYYDDYVCLKSSFIS